jgi:pimeloyl-ACP methyl ester carboxylesterase
MAESLAICACGSGTVGRETFVADGERRTQEFLTEGIEAKVRSFAGLASRRGFAEKDPRGWAEFLRQVRDRSATGSPHILRGVQMKRKTVFELEPELKHFDVPSLIVVGDQDEPCLEPGLFNLHVAEFLAAVENGR